jgi:hypothetical protein
MVQHQDMWPVAVLCEVLEVSRSGFYTYRQRQASLTIDRDELEELAQVKAIAAETGYSYGSRRMAKQLQAAGFAVGRYKARQQGTLLSLSSLYMIILPVPTQAHP